MDINLIFIGISVVLVLMLICGIRRNIQQRETIDERKIEEQKFNRNMVYTFGDVYVKDHGYCQCSHCKGKTRITTPSYIKNGKVYYSAECHFCHTITEINQNEVIFTSNYK